MMKTEKIKQVPAMAVIFSGLGLMGGFHFLSQFHDLPKILQWSADFLTYATPVCIALWYVLYSFKNPFAKKS